MIWFILEIRCHNYWQYVRGIEADGIKDAIAQVERFHSVQGIVLPPEDWRLSPSTQAEVDEIEASLRRETD